MNENFFDGMEDLEGVAGDPRCAKALGRLLDISQAINAILDLDKLLAQVMVHAVEVVGAERGFLMLLDDAGQLDVRTAHRMSGVEVAAVEREVSHSIIQEAIRIQQPLRVVHVAENERFAKRASVIELGLKSVLCAPLMAKGALIGVMYLDHRTQVDAFSEADLDTLQTFGNLAAVAIQNARLFEQVQQEIVERKWAAEELRQSFERLQMALEGTINVLVSAVEMKDPYTAGHQRRVARLACAVAQEMGLPQEQIEGIRMAGLIHDLGKIKIPTEILNKPSRLGEFEWGMLEAHSQVGYDILKTIDFPWSVAQIVLQHHERMDASGYPAGLSGDEIMLEARILAVADVVEAMASFRPYRPALGIDGALEEIKKNRGGREEKEGGEEGLKVSPRRGLDSKKKEDGAIPAYE